MDLLTDAERALREVWRLATALDLPVLAALDPKEAQIALQARQRALDAARADGLQALERLTTLAAPSAQILSLRDEDIAAGFGSRPLQ
jgi:hypothetical protein